MPNELQRLEQLETELAAQPERAGMLRRVRSWRANWLELADALHRCGKDELWRAWGFESFEGYYKAELGLKPAEVQKLLKNRLFLRLELTGEAEPPPLTLEQADVARAAAQAAEESEVPREIAEEIRDAVLKGEPAAAQKRKLQAALDRRAPAVAEQKLQRKVLRTAGSLAAQCEELGGRLPQELRDRLQQALGELREVLAAAAADSAQAEEERPAADQTCSEAETGQEKSLEAAAPAAAGDAPGPGPFRERLFPPGSEDAEVRDMGARAAPAKKMPPRAAPDRQMAQRMMAAVSAPSGRAIKKPWTVGIAKPYRPTAKARRGRS